ncbi:LysR family transcriptional regulator [Sinorhizobium meliloti]|uniref:LysR family transcriptional regulator n=1 Tax=Rhizobium meliloti TaxID=382 RepID=UPI000FD7194F|nr:LysR family transcriptional regulator [Sinorhizobium meliloti]RVH34265.1 LysR family transcriptional regulator [Sinorhizobium meliloti]
MDTDDLRIFLEVADAGGVASTADRLGISKSMVSRGVVRLETALGTQLFARTTRGLSLVEAGTTFYDYAVRVCAEIDIAKETILPAGELRGLLRVAAPLSFGPTHFAPVLAEMARRHPQLQIHTNYCERFVDLVAEGFDCGIRVGFLDDSNLIAKRVGPLHGKLVASPDYIKKYGSPETLKELSAHRALIGGTETWKLMDGDQLVAVKPRGRFKADSGTVLAAAAVAGLGIAALANQFIREYVASGALIPVMKRYPLPRAGIYVVRPPGEQPDRKVRVLTELLIERLEPALSRAADGL